MEQGEWNLAGTFSILNGVYISINHVYCPSFCNSDER